MSRKDSNHYNKPENRDLRDIYMNLESEEPKDHSNLYVGIAIGVMVMICAGIYLAVLLMESV